MNQATLIGNPVRNPASKRLPSGHTVTTFSVATYYTWKDIKTKEKKESVEFHNVVAWGKLGEIASSYLKKGDKVYLEGRLQTRRWKGKDGKTRSLT
jgi:single-strand DNA-binding protein